MVTDHTVSMATISNWHFKIEQGFSGEHQLTRSTGQMGIYLDTMEHIWEAQEPEMKTLSSK